MELDELKQKWTELSEQVEKSDYNGSDYHIRKNIGQIHQYLIRL